MSRAFDSFETRTSRVGGEMADMMEHAQKAGATDEEIARLRSACWVLADAMREVRRRMLDDQNAKGRYQ